jgi:two-component system, cell cycle sensor histidine kinase and response regulator CckA
MLIEDRVNRIAQLAEVGGTPNNIMRDAIRRELLEAVAMERKRTKLASVVAMSEEDAVRYRAISELASDWVYAIRVDEFGKLMIEWVSGSFESTTGYLSYDINELGGWTTALHPDDAEKMYAADSPLMRGDPATIDYRIVTKAGDVRWLRDYACPELDTSERVVRVFGAVKDVTEEMNAQEALRDAKKRLEQRVGFDEARFRSVLDQAGEAIFMIDANSGGFIDVNETACRMLGFTREELLTKHIEDVELGESNWLTPASQLEMRKGSVSTESFYRRSDGTRTPVEVAVSLRRYIGQDYLLVVARDVAERKQLEVQLAQADRLASVGVLAAGVAHEINNPLVYILNNVSYALNELPPQLTELRDALREARSGAERVRDIVKDLKTFARSDERMGPVDVRQVLESSIRVAENEIRFRAQLVRRYEDTPQVEANARLGQVFLNLLLNAAHSIREGDPLNNRIVVSTFVAEGRVAVCVEDTGAGIPREKLGKIFDPFFTTKPIGMGTGLGLSICRNITTALGGEIQVSSEVGIGSRFTVWLPGIRHRVDPVRLPSSIPPPATVKSLRVLVVDDDAFVARAIRRLLRSNHVVTLANGGREALELMAKDEFDVVFCDVMMPVMTGLELHQEVRTRFPLLAERFIFITGGPFTPEARELFDQVKNPCIQKPFTPADLAQVLENASYQRGLDAELESARYYG